jgi:Copper type II ascorbate-dependent monooxygenase, C-terminal domain
MGRNFIIGIFAIAGLLVYQSCQENQVETNKVASSFDLIQTRILNTNCAISGCHQSNTDPAFAQHKLVLTATEAYGNLVDIVPANSNAATDGLMRVKPFKSAESLLYHKLHSSGSEHHLSDYGNPMPLGLPLLSQGQVEFVRRWIEAGAPRGGKVVEDEKLLDDTTPQPEIFEPLPPPEPGTGIQLTLGPFTVAPNFEREFFVYKSLGNTTDMYVTRIEINMRQNSHHFLLYDFGSTTPAWAIPQLDVVRDIRNADGSMNYANMFSLFYHVYVAGAQTPFSDVSLPPGVALLIPSNMALDFNSHYVNKGSVEIKGEVQVNLYTTPVENVQKVARTLNLGNTSFSLPAKQRTTITSTYLMGKKTNIVTLTSHTHQLGEQFVIKIKNGPRDGEVVYTSKDWHHPEVINFSSPLILEAGEGLVSEITYNNTKDKVVNFGLTSEDEMGIIFGYYYED